MQLNTYSIVNRTQYIRIMASFNQDKKVPLKSEWAGLFICQLINQ